MKVSYNWLKECVNIDMEVSALAEKLSMAGLVVEGIEETVGDFVIEFERLPNRPDWLNVIGIAREVSAVCNVDIIAQDINVSNIDENINDFISVEIKDADLCPRYSCRVIKDVKIGPSPDWLRERLEKSGIRSINNVVDITNYVLLEYGHPLHAFDYEKVADKKIIVRRSTDEKINTLDEKECELNNDMLVIADGQKSIAIAGIMGGGNSEVCDITTNVVLESAYFNPSSIRKTSKELNIDTESSYRFERGADVDIVITALNRAASLISEIAGGNVLNGVIDEYPSKLSGIEIEARTSVINSIIGIDISDNEIVGYLEKLGLDVVKEEDGILDVSVPNFRRDITREEDLAEEVARIYGYDNIPITLPDLTMTFFEHEPHEVLIKKLRKRLSANGVTEVINYSFIDSKLQKEYKANSIRLSHPLADTQSVMRVTLMPGILKNLVLNLNHGNTGFNCYEIGKNYYIAVDNVCEDYKLCLVSLEDFSTLKGSLLDVLAFVGMNNVEFVPADNIWCEKDCCFNVVVNGKEAGVVGLLANAKKALFDIKDNKLKIAIAEINLEEILNLDAIAKKYKPISKFPVSKRDLALVMPESVTYKEVVDFMNSIEKSFDFSVELFDTYRGEQVPKGYKSLAFALIFKSDERTLTDQEVDAVFQEIISRFESEKGISLRQ